MVSPATGRVVPAPVPEPSSTNASATTNPIATTPVPTPRVHLSPCVRLVNHSRIATT